AAVLAVCVAAVAIAACGGDGGGDEDPAEVLDATFSNEETVDSGRFDLSVDIASEGGGESAGDFTASLGGPFASEGEGFPQFDIDAEIELESSVQDFSGEIGVTSTGDSAFVNFQGTEYELPADAFREFTSTYEELQQQSAQESGGDQQGGNLFGTLGIDPTGWLTDLSNEGNEDVEGTETVKITGQADVPKLVEDLRTIVERAPDAVGPVTPRELEELGELTDLVESAEFSFFSGADDDLLRKVEGTIGLNPPDSEGSPESVAVDFSLTLSELNEAQEISAPADAQPLQGLLESLGVDLGQISGSGGGGGAANALPEAGGAPQAPSDDATSAYLECLSTAEGTEATQQCAELLAQ
ncbi:MAG: hypothetical protein ACRDKH_07785, partial [Solirubrobacterales bacterium]